VSAQQWGLLDVQDNLWLGDDEGPKIYDDLVIAMCARTVVSIQFGWPASRLRVEPYDSHGAKRDEVEPLMTTLNALRIAEGESPRGRPRRKRKDAP
jgi:hypothetical protein